MAACGGLVEFSRRVVYGEVWGGCTVGDPLVLYWTAGFDSHVPGVPKFWS